MTYQPRKLLQPGSACLIGADRLTPALVRKVVIGAELSVQYRVTWWDSQGERCMDLLDASEVDEASDSEFVLVGRA